MSNLAVGLITLLIGWIASRIYLKRRLFLVVPRLFDYSDLSSGSKTVELLVLNAGKRAEEDIEVRLTPAFSYQVIAATQSALAFNSDGVLRLSRLAPGQEVSLVFLAEGSEQFKKEHILEISSKNAKGKIKNSVVDAQQTPGTIAAGFFFLFVLMGAGYLFIGTFIDDVWPWVQTKTGVRRDLDFQVGCPSISSNSSELTDETLYGVVPSTYEIRRVYRNGSGVYAVILLKNPLKDVRQKFSVQFVSPAVSSQERSVLNDNFVYDITLFPGQEKEVVVGDTLPEKFDPQLAEIEVTARAGGSITIWSEFELAFGKQAPLSKCKGDSANEKASSEEQGALKTS